MPVRRLTRKKRATTGKRPRRGALVIQNGKGFMDVINKVGNAFKKVGGFFKKHKLLSRGLALIPNPGAQLASKGLGMVGLGRRRKRSTTARRRQTGGKKVRAHRGILKA